MNIELKIKHGTFRAHHLGGDNRKIGDGDRFQEGHFFFFFALLVFKNLLVFSEKGFGNGSSLKADEKVLELDEKTFWSRRDKKRFGKKGWLFLM